jgi:small subunit ribosomal protein S20
MKSSAQKALRQSKKRADFNKKITNANKALKKQLRQTILAGKKDEPQAFMSKLTKALDKATKSGIMKKNTANRNKARLQQGVNKIL